MGELTTLLAAEGEYNVLRIPLYEFIIALVAFGIVLTVLAKFALPNVKRILDEREEAIAGGIRNNLQASGLDFDISLPEAIPAAESKGAIGNRQGHPWAEPTSTPSSARVLFHTLPPGASKSATMVCSPAAGRGPSIVASVPRPSL